MDIKRNFYGCFLQFVWYLPAERPSPNPRKKTKRCFLFEKSLRPPCSLLIFNPPQVDPTALLCFFPIDAVCRTTFYTIIYFEFRIVGQIHNFDITGIFDPEYLRTQILAYAALNAGTKVNHRNFHIQTPNNLSSHYCFSNFTAELVAGFQRLLVRYILNPQTRIDNVKFHGLELLVDHFDGFTAPTV